MHIWVVKGTEMSFGIRIPVQVRRSVLFNVSKLPQCGGNTQGSYLCSIIVSSFTAVFFASLVKRYEPIEARIVCDGTEFAGPCVHIISPTLAGASARCDR